MHLKFNEKRELVDRKINGGTYTSEREYIEALREEINRFLLVSMRSNGSIYRLSAVDSSLRMVC